jgi:hypothetical protein
VTYSEQFDNAAWTKYQGATLTSNTTISPDGTQNADTLQVSTSTYSGLYETLSGSSEIYSLSIFAKKLTKRWLYLFDAAAIGAAWFDLENGVLGTVPSGYTASIENFGNGWYRCILKKDSAITPAYFQLGLSDANGSYTPTSTGTAYLWGAQCEQSSYPTSYIPTTSASATRVADACFNTSATALIGQTEGTILLDCEILTTDTQDLLSIRPGGTSSLAIGTASNLILGYVIEGATVISMSFANYAINTRYKIALAYKNGECALYVNGTQADTDTTAFTFSTALSSLYLGQSQYFGKSSYENNEVVLFKTRLTNAELASLTTI